MLNWALCSPCQLPDKGCLCPASQPCPEPCPLSAGTMPLLSARPPCSPPPRAPQLRFPQSGWVGPVPPLTCCVVLGKWVLSGLLFPKKSLRHFWPDIWQHEDGAPSSALWLPHSSWSRGHLGERADHGPPPATERTARLCLPEALVAAGGAGTWTGDPSRSLPARVAVTFTMHRDVGARVLGCPPAGAHALSSTTAGEY